MAAPTSTWYFPPKMDLDIPEFLAIHVLSSS
jgi:hypothetical protein